MDLYHIASERSDDISHLQSEYIAFAKQIYRVCASKHIAKYKKDEFFVLFLYLTRSFLNDFVYSFIPKPLFILTIPNFYTIIVANATVSYATNLEVFYAVINEKDQRYITVRRDVQIREV